MKLSVEELKFLKQGFPVSLMKSISSICNWIIKRESTIYYINGVMCCSRHLTPENENILFKNMQELTCYDIDLKNNELTLINRPAEKYLPVFDFEVEPEITLPLEFDPKILGEALTFWNKTDKGIKFKFQQIKTKLNEQRAFGFETVSKDKCIFMPILPKH